MHINGRARFWLRMHGTGISNSPYEKIIRLATLIYAGRRDPHSFHRRRPRGWPSLVLYTPQSPSPRRSKPTRMTVFGLIYAGIPSLHRNKKKATGSPRRHTQLIWQFKVRQRFELHQEACVPIFISFGRVVSEIQKKTIFDLGDCDCDKGLKIPPSML